MKKKTRISLYGLDSPVLIVPAKTGIVYYNQTGGCATNQNEVEGYLIPIPPADPMDFVFCNHLLWYEKGGWVMEFPPKKSWKNLGISHDETVVAHRNNKKTEACMWWEDVCDSIEEYGEKSGYDMKVVKSVPQEEAWFWVRIRHENGKIMNAFITWHNCD